MSLHTSVAKVHYIKALINMDSYTDHPGDVSNADNSGKMRAMGISTLHLVLVALEMGENLRL
jgi:hypothetical protein